MSDRAYFLIGAIYGLVVIVIALWIDRRRVSAAWRALVGSERAGREQRRPNGSTRRRAALVVGILCLVAAGLQVVQQDLGLFLAALVTGVLLLAHALGGDRALIGLAAKARHPGSDSSGDA